MTLNCTAKQSAVLTAAERNQNMEKINLQLFAEGETTPAVAGEMTETAPLPANGEEMAQEAANDVQEAAAEKSGDSTSADSTPFKVFQTQEDYQSYFDGIIGKRLKGARETGERLQKLEPVIGLLQKKYGVSDETKLAERVRNELITQNAFSEGMTEEQYRQKLDNEDQLQRVQGELDSMRHQQFLFALKGDIAAMAQENAELYGKADAEELAADNRFLALLGQGFGVKEAYNALHMEEIMQKAAQQQTKQVVENIVARGERPAEAASVSAMAGNSTNDVAKMGDDEIDALIKRSMRGERIEL